MLVLIFIVVLMIVPFVYLTSVALLMSAEAHGKNVFGRRFGIACAAPANAMFGAPTVGRIYHKYFEWCFAGLPRPSSQVLYVTIVDVDIDVDITDAAEDQGDL